jgi:D-sedoheptulose 7-phosphate isomerase
MTSAPDRGFRGSDPREARAVFFDRDGVLNEVVWRGGRAGSPRTADELRITAGAAVALERLRAAGFRTFVVTNQPDVARGLLSAEEAVAIQNVVRGTLAVDDALLCPHDDADGCTCRKPKPGMITRLAERWGVDPRASWVIGDRWSDVEAGRAAGCRTILLRRPYNANVSADVVSESVEEAVAVIVTETTPNGAAAPLRSAAPTGHAQRYLGEAAEITALLDAAALERMAESLRAVRDNGGRLFFLGVGGSASNASHAANDFRKVAGFEAYCATDNVAELTARVNDDGWSAVFASWLEGSRLRARDAVFVLSVGGGDTERDISANLAHAIALAKRVGARVFGIVGRDGGYTAAHADHCVLVPVVNAASVTPHTESFQSLLLHLLVSHPLLARAAMKWESLSPERQ